MPKSIKSSLDPKKKALVRQQELETKYRPGNSLLVTESVGITGFHDTGMNPFGKIGRTNSHYREKTVTEDATANALDDFELRENTDCRYQAAQVVKAINFGLPYKRRIEAKRDYLDALERINICPRCRCPIRVTRISLNPERHVKERVAKERYVHVDPYQARRTEYVWSTPKNKSYVDIQSHYEWYSKDGVAWYQYIDGTGRDIRLERVAIPYKRPARKHWERFEADADGMVTKTRFKEQFVEILEDGSKVPVVPEPSYRLFNVTCKCKFRRLVSKSVKVPKV